MTGHEIVQEAKSLWGEIKSAKITLNKSTAIHVSSEKEKTVYAGISSKWFELFSKSLSSYGIQKEVLAKYDNAFRGILRLSDSTNRRSSYIKLFDEIAKGFNDEIVIFLQTDSTQPEVDNDHEFGKEVESLLERISNADENDYLKEALGCWERGYLKAATVLLWCACIDRIHKVIEAKGLDTFNNASVQMKAQTTGRFKRFTKEYNIHSLSELRMVFDSDVLWVIEGMQLIDSNERTRLASCFDMRCHSGHPGSAPITKYNVISCFSDIVEIVLANPTFNLNNC